MSQPPPPELKPLIDFVNTLDIERGTDELATPTGLSEWMGAYGLLHDAGPPARETDLKAAVELREALRALMLANNGHQADHGAGARLERAARHGDLGVHFTEGGSMELLPGKGGIAGGLAELLVPVAQAIADGSWQRIKACRAPSCHWAFYDRSRNHSGVWCDMAVCGNRTKVRTYRQRSPRDAG
jgi:predicted RNA-binding Zn ribbon-like protein